MLIMLMLIVRSGIGIVAWQTPHQPGHGLPHLEESAGDVHDRAGPGWSRQPPDERGDGGDQQDHQQPPHSHRLQI